MNNNKKIAIITTGDIYERRGFVNAVISRAKYLKSIASNLEIDIFLIGTYEPWLVRKLRHHSKFPRPSRLVIDNLEFHIFWQNYSIIDYILRVRLGLPEFFGPLFYKRKIDCFKNYDLLSCHSLECGCLATQIKQRYNIPFVITWHGSDIHTLPFNNTSILKKTQTVIKNASCNFFVSKALMAKSDEITPEGEKKVLYNGCDEIFYRYDTRKILELKEAFNVGKNKIVGFVGNFMEIKNVLLLPVIFRKIYREYPDVCFWMIGDGKLLNSVKNLSAGLPIHFWHGQPVEKMPDFMNLLDVLVLPSKNEGLPLVLTEALSCGTQAISSRVGGCPEVIGHEHTIPLDSPTFCDDFAKAVVDILKDEHITSQYLPTVFKWENSANIEYTTILKILQDQQ